jgi:GTP-binding protein
MSNLDDSDFSAAELESARKLFAGECDFVLGVAGLSQLPDSDLPEIAMAGRSNVGKSTLINGLTHRKNLARTSNTPGRTQELNYFNLGGVLYMVDMPGYGYAKVSKDKRDTWTQLIFDYLRGRANLRCVFILIDARHGLKDSDIVLMEMLDEAAVSYRIVLTKSDKVKNQDRERVLKETQAVIKNHGAAHPELHITSAEKGYGLPELRAIMKSYAD